MEDATTIILVFFILCSCIVICVYIGHAMPIESPPEIQQHEKCTVISTEGIMTGNQRFSNKTIICPPLGVNLNE